jgi:hypothetical protein
MKVEELSRYGKTLSGLPNEVLTKQKAIVFHEIRTKFGLLRNGGGHFLQEDCGTEFSRMIVNFISQTSKGD